MLRGEAGAGKTTLLDDTAAAAAARGMQTARLTGVEPETQLGYAGLHRFLLPFADRLERLPGPQQDALRNTLGLVAGPPADRFLVALAVLTLLADAASAAPLLCVVDDLQWLDAESLVVLGFVARRLYAERVVLLLAVREPGGQLPELAGLPELAVGGLDDEAAMELLVSLAPGRLSPAVGTQIVAETGGNPLALAEMAGQLSAAQLAGLQVLPDPLHIGGSLEQAFSRRVGRLPPEARLLLALAAAEPAASQAVLWRAAAQLGIDPEAAASDDLGGLAEIGPEVVFRHPVIRSAVYHSAPRPQRRLIHQALAAVADAGERPDRVAWHLGMAAVGPDETVAARLEQAAGQARERGGYAATVTFLSRAAELSTDEGARAGRLLGAAEAALIAGQPVRAGALLEEATPQLAEPLARAQARRLDGTIRFTVGQATEAAAILLQAARALAPSDACGAREALLEAVEAAMYVGWSASRAVLAEIARSAREIPPVGSKASAADLLLDGFAVRAAAGYPAAVPLFRRAVALLCSGDLGLREGLRLPRLGCFAAAELFDNQASQALATRWVQLARGQGALTALPVALNFQGAAELAAGRFEASTACLAERSEIIAATRNPGAVGTAGVAEMYELAWRGRETDARQIAAAAGVEAMKAGRASPSIWVQYCLGLLDLGLGNYQEALQCALNVHEDDAPFFSTVVLPDLVEAGARCGETSSADAALGRLAERSLTAGTPLALGLLARSRALLASDADAGPLYEQAIEHLKACRAAPQLARAHLVYGEWLRRQRRRRDARLQLRAAHEMLTSMGAGAFAERARAELLAAGERARPPTAGTVEQLTPREAQIAALVSQGESNRDVAAQLFLSPSTVDYHLRKVFRKVGVGSRTQLARAMNGTRPWAPA